MVTVPWKEGYYLVEVSIRVGTFTMCEYLVSGGEGKTQLAGCAEIAPAEVIGIAQAPLVRIPMSNDSLWDQNDYFFVGNVVGVPKSKVLPHRDESEDLFASGRDTAKADDLAGPRSALLSRLNPDQWNAFLDLSMLSLIRGSTFRTICATFVLICKVLVGPPILHLLWQMCSTSTRVISRYLKQICHSSRPSPVVTYAASPCSSAERSCPAYATRHKGP